MNKKYEKFLAVAGLAFFALGIITTANAIDKHVNESKICQPIGVVTEIISASSTQYNMDINTIDSNGNISHLQSKNINFNEDSVQTKTFAEKIQSIHSKYYNVSIKAKVGDQIKDLRMKNLKIGDSLEQCKYDVKVIKK